MKQPDYQEDYRMNMKGFFATMAAAFLLLSAFSTYQSYKGVLEIKRLTLENAELSVKNIGLGIDLTTSEMNHVVKDLSYLENIKDDSQDGNAQNDAVKASKLEEYSKLELLRKEQRANLESSKRLLEKIKSL